ncbi:MAG: respiratory nitrate reductase subunit gamma [Magnetovibrio sp.]|nr:respiratory nitrate reductase subunit gamma [Magnetovibrio sp.]
MQYLNEVVFGYYPYFALTVFLLGSLIRFDRDQYTWRSGSSQLLRNRQMMVGSNLFHIGILSLFGGHFVGLLTPIFIFEAMGITHAQKQMLAVGAGGVFGIMCFIGLTMLLHRRLTDPRIRATSSSMDIFIQVMLWVQLVLGLFTLPLSMGHAEGEMMVRFMNWAQHIVTFRAGAASYILDVPVLFKAHLVIGMTMFLIFPFTRLVHVWSAPVGYLVRRYQVVRTRRKIG